MSRLLQTIIGRGKRPRADDAEQAGQDEAAQLWFADGLDFCWICAQRQPWLRDDYTAGAGYGNMNA